MIRILIIDNHRVDDGGFVHPLSAQGYKVYVAGEKEDGVEIASRYNIDIILCYLENVQTGESVIKALQACETTQTTPLIYISSTPDFAVMRRMMSLGADDFFCLPVESTELILAIEKRLEKKRALENQVNTAVNAVFDGKEKNRQAPDHFIVTIGCKLKLIKFSDVVCISAQREYSLIRTCDSKEISVRRSLKTWTRLLPQSLFLQIHRSTIINIEAVEKILKSKERAYVVYLKGIPDPFCLSQRFMNVMRRTFPRF